MSKTMTLAVFGGDMRQVYMARKLAEMDYRINVWGLGACMEEIGSACICSQWEEALEKSDAVILPLPATADGVRVNCPLQSEDVFLRLPALLDAMGDRLLFGGRLSEGLLGIAEQKGVRCMDYFACETLQLKNALPTAEGAISVAMKELTVTLADTPMTVFGFGRIGALLADKLRALGVPVTVYARREEQLTLARLHHHDAKKLPCNGELPELPVGTRALFNTVPQRILSEDRLMQIPKNCILIDLASPPGGYDHKLAADLGYHTIWATALPGKHTPETAGFIIAETVNELLSQVDI